MKIEIHTRLADGIYRSSGGGQDRLVAVHRLSARGLMMAVRLARRLRRTNAEHYGQIGAGSTWVEIDGYRLDEIDMSLAAESTVAAGRWMAGRIVVQQ